MRQHLARIVLGLAITLFFVGHALGFYRVGFIDRLDDILYDARLAMTMPRGVDERIVILDIDEASLGEIGRWPWPRDLMSELLDKLFERHGAQVVAFDVVWAERDPSSGMPVLDALARGPLRDDAAFAAAYAKLRPRLDYDARFAAAMRGRPVVLGYYFNSEQNAVRANALPPPVLPRGTFRGRNVRFHEWRGYTGNLAPYTAAAAGAGHFNPLVDADGVVRRVPLLAEFEGEYYEALPLAVVRAYYATQLGAPPPVEPGYPEERPQDLEWLSVGPLTIPVDENAAALVPYRGPKRSFPYVPLADVLKDRVRPGALKGRIALVGATAPALQDLRATPVDSAFPGVEVHANMIAGILDETLMRRPWFTSGAEAVLLAIGGTALALLIPLVSALWASALVALGIALITGFNVAVWSVAGTVLPLASSILMALALYTVNMAYGYFVESRSKRLIARRFREYVPPEVVEKMERDPAQYDMPRDAELTILFSDVRDFTHTSESLEPEALREYINEYLTAMSAIIRGRHGGTLDKYIGDAIMAFWGAPLEDPQHARHALLAALDMAKECEVLNRRFAARGWPPLRIGVGLNTGRVRVGDMGSQVRRAYTAMGDAVNVASRLEGRTKYYGVGILVGEATRAQAPDVLFREVDRIRVKGREGAITVYEPLGLAFEAGPEVRAELAQWDEMLAALRAGRWNEAERHLEELERRHPQRALLRIYAERLAALRRAPPPPGGEAPIMAFDEK
ncbi:MAG TPA: CHASE2 domain-containing protein [Burkholderiales bacterium]